MAFIGRVLEAGILLFFCDFLKIYFIFPFLQGRFLECAVSESSKEH